MRSEKYQPSSKMQPRRTRSASASPKSLCYNPRMGSGQGKARRAHRYGAQPVRLNSYGPAVNVNSTINFFEEADYDFGKWVEFTRESGMERTRVYSYYLGRNHLGQEIKVPTPTHLEKLVTELFVDAVGTGAITLPGKYKVEDFEFKMKQDGSPRSQGNVLVFLRGKPDLIDGKFRHGVPIYASYRTSMAHRCVKYLLKQLVRDMNYLFLVDSHVAVGL